MRRTAVQRLAILYRSRHIPFNNRSYLCSRTFTPAQRGLGSLSSWMPWFSGDVEPSKDNQGLPPSERLVDVPYVKVRDDRTAESGEVKPATADDMAPEAQNVTEGGAVGRNGSEISYVTNPTSSPSQDSSATGAENLKGLVDELALESASETKGGIIEHLGNTDLFQAASWYDPFINMPIRLLLWVNEATGLPWWATIATTTMLVRTAVLPLTLYTIKGTANLQKIEEPLKIKMQAYQTAVKEGYRDVAQQYRTEMKKLRKDNGATVSRLLAGPLIQAPLFLTFFVAIRRLAKHHPELATGGIYWFSDLSAADPIYVLPILASVTMLGMVEFGGESSKMAPGMKNVMRGLSFVFVPATAKLSSAIFMYWIPNNILSTAISLVTKRPKVRYLLGFKDALKPLNAHDQTVRRTAHVSREEAILSYIRAKNPKASVQDLKKQNAHLFNTPLSKEAPARKSQRRRHAIAD